MEYLNKIKNVLEKENIKYNEDELKKVIDCALKKYKDKNVLDDSAIDFVSEVASEVATLRLDDKSVYAAILYLIADFNDFILNECLAITPNGDLARGLCIKQEFLDSVLHYAAQRGVKVNRLTI